MTCSRSFGLLYVARRSMGRPPPTSAASPSLPRQSRHFGYANLLRRWHPQKRRGPPLSPYRVCTSIEFCQRVLPERVEATEGAKPVRILRHLLTCPIVLGPHLRVFVTASESLGSRA